MKRKTSLMLASAIAAPAILTGAYAHANTLTRLMPDLYAALDVVSRELVGFVPSAARNANAERAAVGQSVIYPITPQLGTFNVTPAMVPPEPADHAVGYGEIKITKSKGVEFGWTGEEQRGLNTGAGYLTVQGDLFAQALRTLVNEVEADLALEAAMNSSRAYGTAGTTAFGGDKMTDAAQMRKILDDNGAPLADRSLVLDTAAGANMRSMYNLTRANEAGTTMTLRQGELLDLMNFSVKESAQVVRPAIGTNNGSAATTNAGFAVGATTIALGSAGTGTIVAGDVITFAGDTNKYLVVTGDADVSGGGSIVIAAPGLRVAIPTSATVITTVARSTRGVAFSRDALHLVARAPALPVEGDLAIDRMLLTDPRSGLTFEVAIYPGYRKIRAEVTLAWGVKAVKPAHIATLLG